MNGIDEKNRKRVSEAIEKLLADTYALFLKTQNYHWNVSGDDFNDLHEMYEKQYTEMFTAIDELAERIRMLGFRVPGTFERFNAVTSISPGNAELDTEAMTVDLADSHGAIIKAIREVAKIAHECGDFGTVDFLSDRLQAHEKFLWMLRTKTSTDNSKPLIE
ncbi:MAG: Dps family protein [Candidatus Woesearchaeota archaeon]